MAIVYGSPFSFPFLASIIFSLALVACGSTQSVTLKNASGFTSRTYQGIITPVPVVGAKGVFGYQISPDMSAISLMPLSDSLESRWVASISTPSFEDNSIFHTSNLLTRSSIWHGIVDGELRMLSLVASQDTKEKTLIKGGKFNSSNGKFISDETITTILGNVKQLQGYRSVFSPDSSMVMIYAFLPASNSQAIMIGSVIDKNFKVLSTINLPVFAIENTPFHKFILDLFNSNEKNNTNDILTDAKGVPIVSLDNQGFIYTAQITSDSKVAARRFRENNTATLIFDPIPTKNERRLIDLQNNELTFLPQSDGSMVLMITDLKYDIAFLKEKPLSLQGINFISLDFEKNTTKNTYWNCNKDIITKALNEDYFPHAKIAQIIQTSEKTIIIFEQRSHEEMTLTQTVSSQLKNSRDQMVTKHKYYKITNGNVLAVEFDKNWNSKWQGGIIKENQSGFPSSLDEEIIYLLYPNSSLITNYDIENHKLQVAYPEKQNVWLQELDLNLANHDPNTKPKNLIQIESGLLTMTRAKWINNRSIILPVQSGEEIKTELVQIRF